MTDDPADGVLRHPPERPQDLWENKRQTARQRREQAVEAAGCLDDITAAMTAATPRLLKQAEEGIKQAAREAGKNICNEVVQVMADAAASPKWPELRPAVKQAARDAADADGLAERVEEWFASEVSAERCPALGTLRIGRIAAAIKAKIEQTAAEPVPDD